MSSPRVLDLLQVLILIMIIKSQIQQALMQLLHLFLRQVVQPDRPLHKLQRHLRTFQTLIVAEVMTERIPTTVPMLEPLREGLEGPHVCLQPRL